MSLPLTKMQAAALPYIEWLFDDALSNRRATGRTTLMAYYFINKAITTGKPIEVFDHYMPSSFITKVRAVLPVIEFMYNTYYKDDFNLEINKKDITIKMTRKDV
jgi:hypothetical protein